MKKMIVVTGFFLALSHGFIMSRKIHMFNFLPNDSAVFKADVANARDTTKEVAALSSDSAGVFGCEGVNDVRKVEVRSKLGEVTVEGGWSACRSRQAFLTPIVDSNGVTIGLDLEIR